MSTPRSNPSISPPHWPASRWAHTPWRYACIAALVWFLHACRVGPDYESPQLDMPEEWQSADAELTSPDPTDVAWWQQLEDPLLDRLIEDAGGQNLGLLAALGRIDETRAQVGLSRAELFPDFDATGSVRRSKNSRNGVNSDVDGFQFDPRTLHSIGAEVSWEIDLWGRLRRGLEASKGELEASVEDYRNALVLLQAEVAQNYVELRLAQRRARIARSNGEAQTRAVELTQARHETGLGTDADVRRSRTLLRQTQATVPTLDAAQQQARNRLAQLLGRFPGSLDRLLEAEAELPEVPLQIAVGIPHEQLLQRPDVRAAERRLAAQTARIGVAKAERYPRIDIIGSFSYESSTLDNLFEQDSEAFSIGPFLTWNLFDFGRVERAIDIEEARTAVLALEYRGVVIAAAEEVERHMQLFAADRERAQLLSEAFADATRSLQLLRVEYEEGLVEYLNVLDALRTRLQLEDELAQAEAAVLLDLIALYKALGGGWREPEAP